MAETAPLLPLVRKLFETDVVAAARMLESLPTGEVLGVLQTLPPDLAAQAVHQLQVTYAAAVLTEAPADQFKAIAERLESRHAATLFMHLEREARERFFAGLPDRLKRDIQDQLSYPEGSVGRLMSTNVLTFRTDATVGEAVQTIRELAPRRYPASYAYVVGEDRRLEGVLNMRDLLLAGPQTRLGTIMRTELFTLQAFTDREEAAAQLSKRRYFAAPVVDPDRRLLGIIKAEQLLHGVQEEVTEDLQRMFGAGGDERSFSPLGYSLRKRLPWLHVNLATAFLAAAVVALFEDVIARITVLAVFLPVVAGQGGNAGAQSLAIVMRGLVMREIPRERVRRLILKETLLGAISGTVTGLVTAGVAWAWHGNPWLGLVIGLAMIVNLVVAGLSGAAIPVLMKAVGLDPAQCSSIILTTVTDVVGFFAFLGFAVLFQSRLI